MGSSQVSHGVCAPGQWDHHILAFLSHQVLKHFGIPCEETEEVPVGDMDGSLACLLGPLATGLHTTEPHSPDPWCFCLTPCSTLGCWGQSPGSGQQSCPSIHRIIC